MLDITEIAEYKCMVEVNLSVLQLFRNTKKNTKYGAFPLNLFLGGLLSPLLPAWSAKTSPYIFSRIEPGQLSYWWFLTLTNKSIMASFWIAKILVNTVSRNCGQYLPFFYIIAMIFSILKVKQYFIQTQTITEVFWISIWHPLGPASIFMWLSTDLIVSNRLVASVFCYITAKHNSYWLFLFPLLASSVQLFR